MIIRKYGLTLHRLMPEHLELVRQKRNSEAVRRHMFYQEIISEEQQVAWYKANHNAQNFYFVMEYEGNQIGLISGKNVDYGTGTSEGGIFIWDERYWNSFVPVMATVIMADITFNLLSFNQTSAEVRGDNAQQLHYNKMLGYVPDLAISDEHRTVMVLTKENYESKGAKIRRAVHLVGKDSTRVSWDDIDFSTVTEEDREKLYSNHSPNLQAIFNARFHPSEL